MNVETELKTLIGKRKIALTVKRLATEICRDYRDKETLLLVGILKGSFVFLADLIRSLDMPLELDFVRLASYENSTQSSGKITLIHELTSLIRGRHILVVEDIIDTGLTTSFLLDYLQQRCASSIKLCSLLDKPSRRQVQVKIDYLGFTVPDKFIVGYGLDLKEKYRNLPDICFIQE